MASTLILYTLGINANATYFGNGLIRVCGSFLVFEKTEKKGKRQRYLFLGFEILKILNPRACVCGCATPL